MHPKSSDPDTALPLKGAWLSPKRQDEAIEVCGDQAFRGSVGLGNCFRVPWVFEEPRALISGFSLDLGLGANVLIILRTVQDCGRARFTRIALLSPCCFALVYSGKDLPDQKQMNPYLLGNSVAAVAHNQDFDSALTRRNPT